MIRKWIIFAKNLNKYVLHASYFRNGQYVHCTRTSSLRRQRMNVFFGRQEKENGSVLSGSHLGHHFHTFIFQGSQTFSMQDNMNAKESKFYSSSCRSIANGNFFAISWVLKNLDTRVEHLEVIQI